MSISSRISSMEEHVTNAYNGLQGLGADLTNVNKNIENISMVLDDIYDSMPQVSGEGTSLTLEDTRVGKIKSTLKGNTSQTTYSGKNLFNIEGRYETGTGIEYTKNDDGSYTLNGTANGNNFLRGVYHLNEQHTLSYTSNVSNSNVILRTRTGTPSAQTGIQDQLAVSSTSGNLTSSKQFDFVEISIVSGTTLNNFKIYIQLEKGSSVTSFEPYVGGTASLNPSYPQPVNVVSGDNEIKISGSKNQIGLVDSASTTTTGVTYSISNQILSINGTATGKVNMQEVDFNILASGSKTFKVVKESGTFTSGAIGVSFRDSNNTQLNFIEVSYNGTYSTKNIDITNLNHIVVYVTNGSTFSNAQIKVMLSDSNTDTYEPYLGNTYNIDLPEGMELCKIGNYQDYIYKENGNWYISQAIIKRVYNGTENWSKSSNTSVDRFLKGEAFSALTGGYCDKYPVSNNVNTEINRLFLNAGTQVVINFSSYGTTTLEQFKTWLSSNNVTLYFVRSNSIAIEITYQPLIDQLNALELALSKNGQTNISQVNNDLPFIISASALKEWQESNVSTLSMSSPLLGNINTIDLQPIESDIQPLEINEEIEPLEEG